MAYPYSEGTKPDLSVGLMHRAELLHDAAKELEETARRIRAGAESLREQLARGRPLDEISVGAMASDVPGIAGKVHRHASIVDAYVELAYFQEKAR